MICCRYAVMLLFIKITGIIILEGLPSSCFKHREKNYYLLVKRQRLHVRATTWAFQTLSMASNFISHHSHSHTHPQDATLLARFRAALADRFLVPGFCRFGECGRQGPGFCHRQSLVCVCPLRINSTTLSLSVSHSLQY